MERLGKFHRIRIFPCIEDYHLPWVSDHVCRFRRTIMTLIQFITVQNLALVPAEWVLQEGK